MTKLYEYTAVGRYYKVYNGGEYVSQHTTEREAIERANEIKLDNPDNDVFYLHDYEVTVGLTDAGVTIAQDYGVQEDLPPTIIGNPPAPVFQEGVADTYSMASFFSDDGISTVTSSLSNVLPNGLTYNGATHVLSYDGVGAPTLSSHALTVTDAVGSDTSGLFSIEVVAAESFANDKAQAQSWDAAWLSSWVARSREILASNPGQAEGMFVHFGDSLTRTPHIGAWSIARTGATAEDNDILDWMHAGTSTADLDTLDGYYLQAPDKTTNKGFHCSNRSYTVGDGLGAWSYLNETPMPSITDQTAAREALENCALYSPNDLNLTTILSALGNRPQFATVQVNLKFSDPTVLPGGFEEMHDALEAAGIVPIIITSTYRIVGDDTELWMDTTDTHNDTLRAFAEARGYPLIDLQAEMERRRPILERSKQGMRDAWTGKFISSDDIHLTATGHGGFESDDNPYANGGDSATHATGEMLTWTGYGLRGWLIAQKMKQIRQLVVQQDPLSLPLYDTSKINYLGYFLVPGEKSAQTGQLFGENHQGFGYANQGSGGMAFNPDGDGGNGSIFLGGSTLGNNARDTIISEISIPEPVMSNAPRATLLQDYVLACGTPGKQHEAAELGADGGGGNGYPLAGMIVYNGKLYMTVTAVYYSKYMEYTLYVRDSLDLANGNVTGPYSLSTTINNRWTGAGGGDPIPTEFQPIFNGNKVFGGGTGHMSIAGNYSFGPSILAWNPDDLDGVPELGGIEPDKLVFWGGLKRNAQWDPIPTDGSSPWPQNTREQHSTQDTPPAFLPPAPYNHSCMQRMSFMVPGSRTVFCFGRYANSFYDTFAEEAGPGYVQGLQSDPEFRAERLWMFDAADLADNIPNPDPNGPMWYDVHDMNISAADKVEDWDSGKQRWATFDPVRRRLYICIKGDGNFISEETKGGMPIIHVVEFPE